MLRPGDLLVTNDTKVMPARLWGRKQSGGKVELLLVRPLAEGSWQAWMKGSRKPQVGDTIQLEEGIEAQLIAREGRECQLRFSQPLEQVQALMQRHGAMPLPPYIERDQPETEDQRRYQTVYARELGAVAAPTAGLHFTEELLDQLTAAGVERASVTLHVGPGTFQPLSDDQLESGELHEERYSVSAATWERLQACRERGGRVVAVGTTSVRALESCDGPVEMGETRLFIRRGFRFRWVDVMITNFHLPRSSLLHLVAAFAGERVVKDAYLDAIERDYRFYSYGDAMMLERA